MRTFNKQLFLHTKYYLLPAVFFLSTILLGCATIKETAKGFAGVSTQVLEEKRKDALNKSFVLDYNSCYIKVRDILQEKGREYYIYAEDAKKKMIGIYLSEADTTPVGIFFTEEEKGRTMVEISSPSTYAKEYIANKIFTGIEVLLKLDSEEKKADVKQKINN
jgi:hypothetical protein